MRIGHASYLPLSGGTLTGDLNIGAHNLRTTDVYLSQYSSSAIQLRNAADEAFLDLYLRYIAISAGISSTADAVIVRAKSATNNYMAFQAQDTGVGSTEIARLQGAADPYFQATLPMVLKPASAPGTPVEGHFYYDATDDILKYRDSAAWRDVFGEAQHMVVQAVKKQITYEDTSPITLFTAPAGSIIFALLVNVTTLFNGTAPTIVIGDAADPDGYISTGIITLGTVGWYPPKAGARYGTYLNTYPSPVPAEEPIIATIDWDGSTQGVADVYIVYVKVH